MQQPEPTIENARALMAQAVIESDHIIFLAAMVAFMNLRKMGEIE